MKALAQRVTLAQLHLAGIGDVVVITKVITVESPVIHELPTELEQDAKFGA